MSEISDIVMAEPLFDAHEHQHGFTSLQDEMPKLDYRCFLGYAWADVATAAGVSGKNLDKPADFFDIWRFCRTTGYGRATEAACEGVLGLPFTVENVPAINAALKSFVSSRSSRQIYDELFAKANIRWVMNDECWDSPTKLDYFAGREHPTFFRHALRCDGVISVKSADQVRGFEKQLGCSIHSLAQLDRALDDHATKAMAAGFMGAFKCGLAYHGNLRFDQSDESAAGRIFDEIMQGRGVSDYRPLMSYLFHKLVQRAGEFKLPLQIHTGYLAGNWGNPSQGDPTPLIPVFARYRNQRFDLFHAGWPFTDIMGAIGKSYPNTWLNLCWAWSMSPDAIERTLYEWLSTVPSNKIFAFGGDTGLPFATLGYAIQARRGVAKVLERKIAAGEYDLATASFVARRVMWENACEVYPMPTMPTSQRPARPLTAVTV